MTTSFRGGSAEAPSRIRYVSRSLELCSVLTDVDIESIGFEDLGDIVLPPGDMKASLERIERVIAELLSENRIVFAVGGEHTITLPAFKSLSRKSRKACLLVFDAHADLRDEYMGSKYNHATVIRRIAEETNGKIVVVGARALSREELIEYKKLMNYVNIVRIYGDYLPVTTFSLREALKECTDIYVSLDIDVIDPSFAPGVQTPEPLGMSSIMLLRMLSEVIDSRVRMVDIVEVTPRSVSYTHLTLPTSDLV